MGLVLALVPIPDPVRVAAVLPLLLILPGYALAAALFLPGEISRELRAVLSVAFSVAASVLGGLVVQLVIGLDRPVWGSLLVLVTVLAAAQALRRRDRLPVDLGVARPSPPWVGPASLAAFVAALAIAGGAIAIATGGVHRQRNASRFSSLSLVPDATSGAAPVRVEVLNHEGRSVAYRLIARRGPRTIGRWRIHLGANQDWQTQLAASAMSGKGRLIARLDRGGRPYHRVALRIRGPS
jgi:uncharacterized membrane protein